MSRTLIYFQVNIIWDFPKTYRNASVHCQSECICLHKTVNMVVFVNKCNENTNPNERALMQMYRVVSITQRGNYFKQLQCLVDYYMQYFRQLKGHRLDRAKYTCLLMSHIYNHPCCLKSIDNYIYRVATIPLQSALHKRILNVLNIKRFVPHNQIYLCYNCQNVSKWFTKNS